MYTNDSVGTGHLTLKGAFTNFGRNVLTNTVVFKASQTTCYTEASYTGHQYLSDGTTTPGYPVVAALLRYRTGPWTVVLNAKNVFDYRQTRCERVVLPVGGNFASPLFRELWAPVEGRVVNLSLNWRVGQ